MKMNSLNRVLRQNWARSNKESIAGMSGVDLTLRRMPTDLISYYNSKS